MAGFNSWKASKTSGGSGKVEDVEAVEILGADDTDDTDDINDTELADDFPGVDELRSAGYTTYSDVIALSKNDLTAIKGIGNVTADVILKDLREL